MTSSKRGGAFWAFVFGIAFGAVLGAVLMHKYVRDHATPASLPPPTSPFRSPTNPPESHDDDSIARLLREWRLSPEEIRREVDRAGQVIKREGSAITERIDAATLDPRIVAWIEAKFTLDAQLSSWDIGVTSQAGHVTLTGTVNSPDLAVRAVVLALDTRGVVDVTSSLRVKDSAAPPLPPVEP